MMDLRKFIRIWPYALNSQDEEKPKYHQVKHKHTSFIVEVEFVSQDQIGN
jgi:hypothetical protein